MENIFVPMVLQHAEDIRSGKVSKGQFIGKYTQVLNSKDKDNTFRYKRPQFISNDSDPKNNWVDYIIEMDSQEYQFFISALT